MRITVTVIDPRDLTDQPVRELSRWLDNQERSRGRFQLVESRRRDTALNDAVLALVADLGPPGVTAFGALLIAWLRHRTSDVRVVVRRPDGARLEMDARRIRALDHGEIQALTDQFSAALNPPAAKGDDVA